MMTRTISLMALVFGLITIAGPMAYAADADDYRDFSKMTPSATVDFHVRSVKLIAGASWGKGTLHYKGKDYAIKLIGLSAGGLGVRSIKGSGDVYDLNHLEDFAGKYTGIVMGGTVGKKTMGKGTFENGQRVVVKATFTDAKGLQSSSGLSAVEIEFAD